VKASVDEAVSEIEVESLDGGSDAELGIEKGLPPSAGS